MNADVRAVAEVRDLRIEVAGRALVDGVSLRARPGRVTALVGASGSGKTTTGLALLGSYPAGAVVSGEIRVADGLAGYVPQHPAAVLNPARRVGALLTDIARRQVRELPRGRRRAAARERVLSALAAAHVADGPETVERYPHQLSGGQQQRVVLAQALLLGARVIVADEPTTGQDALTKRRVVAELAAVAQRGIALVLLSHDLEVVRELADDILVLRAGQVVEEGPADRLLTDPRHPWTRQLLAPPPTPAHGHPRAAPPTARADTDDAGPRRASPPCAEGLVVRGLTARHRAGGRRGGVAVVHGADLAVAPGESLALVGRSGSGKTTLARCVAGLHRDFAGRVLLDGAELPRSLRDRTRAELAAVQYVFQDARAAFDAYRPVLDQVARTAVRLRGATPGAAREQATTTLAATGLSEELAARRPEQLSGGELQRAALARALLARPRVLLCDEVTSGLDAVTRHGILRLLATLLRNRGDLALVLITHDLETAALAHRVAVLDAGEIVEQGTAHQVLTAPRHPFTASLVTASQPYAPGAGGEADDTVVADQPAPP
ncbi:ATP-binding cassette domain-containing protein [Streptomyces sp. 71268]|uniref:ABC transporter ATP-binding protein n=1 Tax=Streptomyces sp. 71268 TaxID=3002640 RepID=UPI0023F8DC9C|nr:ATP-binding cassette domain-containing protein [Streptomyces sp. 71268]WEV29393.1 ATP-binding cassette domain-containing protein [Streptomyces sp. 71268]